MPADDPESVGRSLLVESSSDEIDFKINVSKERYPFCIVWQPLPFITWCVRAAIPIAPCTALPSWPFSRPGSPRKQLRLCALLPKRVCFLRRPECTPSNREASSPTARYLL